MVCRLNQTKKRMVIKSGGLFANPVLRYEEIKLKSKHCKQRYVSKVSVTVIISLKYENSCSFSSVNYANDRCL